jgi:CRP-like cAMP-binding protein
MTGLAGPSGVHAVHPVIWKLRSLGLQGEAEAQALLALIKRQVDVSRGQEIIAASTSPTHLTVLLEGIACLYEKLEGGGRQIHAFQLPGDFCDLGREVLPEPSGTVAVAALTDCTVGTIRHSELDRTLEQHSELGLALWRATMLEASISREWLHNVSRGPALQQVAHLLCELLARFEVIGIHGGVIPIGQIDLADATGLSAVQINRILQNLRKSGVLSDNARAIEVSDRKSLVHIAGFDGSYLEIAALLAQWQVQLKGPAN